MLNTEIEKEIGTLISQKNYPCLAAIKSFQRKDFEFKIFRDFGKCDQRKGLRHDLLKYLKEYLETKSPYLTFWAVFPDAPAFKSTEEFNFFMEKELGALRSGETKDIDRDPRFSENPTDDNYLFSLWGHAFTVTGLHPWESDRARCFPFVALVFNVYDQFEQLSTSGWTHISHLSYLEKQRPKKKVVIQPRRPEVALRPYRGVPIEPQLTSMLGGDFELLKKEKSQLKSVRF